MGRLANSLSIKLAQLLLSLVALVTITFSLIRLFPGSPLIGDEKLDPLVYAQLNQYFHLDQGYWQQLARYCENLLQGDFGSSMHYLGKSVNSLIFEHGKVSFQMGFSAFVLAVVFSLAYAVLTRLFKIAQIADRLMLSIYSVPLLVLGPCLIWFFSFHLDLLPVALLESKRAYVLPIFLLTLKPMVSLSRVLSESLDRVLDEPYIVLAQIQGYSRFQLICQWALKNSWTPYLVQIAPVFAGLVSGSFLIEMMFSLPGLGNHFLESVMNRDWPLIMGLTIFYGSIILLTHFVMDIIANLIDPRLQA